MTARLRFDVLTLFPEMFPGPLGQSLPGKALAQDIWALNVMDVRDAAQDKHRTVDDTPYGGGAGMVMRPDVAAAALALATERFGGASRRIYLSPRGRKIDQALVQDLAGAGSVLLMCGRYEGIDERAIEAGGLEEVSLGDFVLAGGELAAMALIEACTRLLPGVLGNEEAVKEESFAAGLLEYPHYTRPAVWEGRAVPEVLISGHHEKVQAWRRAEAERITRERRPDLWQRAAGQKVITGLSTGLTKEKVS
ncbi:MAG: tRNA (guanosine(37)-N1)-methyltransferase TrmD [Alphaproteobacteria bacterium]|nr:tRNA (guanosine(37)-N1)-methyltransferase TrmD [Alphaproteobacteria bacterium]